MSADERALLLAIHAAPDDDLPRLVYADFLDDAGQPHRAAFIRLQCDWHRALVDPTHEPFRIHLYNRLQDEFPGGVPGPPDSGGAVVWSEYRRGLPTEAVVHANELPGPVADVFLLAPLVRAEVREASVEQLEALAELPRELTATLRHLRLVPTVPLPPLLADRLRRRFGDALPPRPR